MTPRPTMLAAAPRHATRLVATLLALLLASATVVVAPAEAAPRPRTPEELRIETELVRLHNDARQHPGRYGVTGFPAVDELAAWTDIREVARGWSDHLGTTRSLAHNPDYGKQMCCWQSAGENVGQSSLRYRTPEEAARGLLDAFLKSPGHLRNVMHARWDDFGIGANVDGAGNVWVTINFRTRSDTAPPGSQYNTAGTTPPPPTEPSRPVPVARDITDSCGHRQARGFGDTNGNVHDYAIRCIVALGITTGKTATSYGPHDDLTRGQTASFLMRMLAAAGQPIPPEGHVQDAFHDDAGSTHEHALNVLVHFGVINPTPDRRIAPGEAQNRLEMAWWTHAAVHARVEGAHRGDYYDDDDRLPGEYGINRLSDFGIITGKGGTTYAPGDRLTRAQMATFLARAYDALLAGA